MAKPGQRSDRSAARIRSESGEAVSSVLLMIDLEGEHCAQNGVRQMIVAGIAGEIGVEVLDGMVHVLLGGDFFVIAIQLRFTIFLRTVFRNLCRGEMACGGRKWNAYGVADCLPPRSFVSVGTSG